VPLPQEPLSADAGAQLSRRPAWRHAHRKAAHKVFVEIRESRHLARETRLDGIPDFRFRHRPRRAVLQGDAQQ
jgi:hypothetical protein